jgi:DNA-binding XRE family transcriptional regulator
LFAEVSNRSHAGKAFAKFNVIIYNYKLSKLPATFSISFTTINKLENGKLNPTLATVYAIADSLKVDVKELFD